MRRAYHGREDLIAGESPAAVGVELIEEIVHHGIEELLVLRQLLTQTNTPNTMHYRTVSVL